MNKIIKRTLKITGYTFGTLIALLLLYAGMSWLLPHIAVNKDACQKGPDDITIYIKSNGVHTDIVVPVKNEFMDWNKVIKISDTDSKDTTFQYASMGWGDKGFYLETPQWSDLKASTAFKAMFHLGTSAMHITFYKTISTGELCKAIKISNAEYIKLVSFLKNSFTYDEQGNTINIITHNDGYGTDDAFYESPAVYDLFHTCNTWANNALKACDQRACLWTPLDKGIFYQYRNQ
jgi:uncharacterized protein (TIGR02117 family)